MTNYKVTHNLLKTFNTTHNLHLYCDACHCEWSAHPGDYWQLNPSEPIKCYCQSSRGRNVQLVRKYTLVERVPHPTPKQQEASR